MSIHPGYSGQKFMPEALERVRTLRELLPADVHVQVDGGVDDRERPDVHEAGATCSSRATRDLRPEDLPRAYRRLVQALA